MRMIAEEGKIRTVESVYLILVIVEFQNQPLNPAFTTASCLEALQERTPKKNKKIQHPSLNKHHWNYIWHHVVRWAQNQILQPCTPVPCLPVKGNCIQGEAPDTCCKICMKFSDASGCFWLLVLMKIDNIMNPAN